MVRRIIFDIETDGLKRQVSKVHLLMIRDLDSEQEWVFRNQEIREQIVPMFIDPQYDLAPFVGWIEDGLKMLTDAELVIGHNIIDYDIPVLETLYPGFEIKGQIRDTLVLTRLIFSDIKEDDYGLFRRGVLPGKLIGTHGLKAWGYRLGELKGDYDASAPDAWVRWTPEMEAYGRQDVVVNKLLYEYLDRRITKTGYSQEAIVLEHRFANLLTTIEDNGFPFDVEKAEQLKERLENRRKDIEKELLNQFRPWWKATKWKAGSNGKPMRWVDAEVTVPTKTLNYKDPLKASRTAGAPFCPIKLEEFNPGSRDQIADRLQRMFGWVPNEFTDTGKPRVSEDILRDLVGTLDEAEDGVEETESELYDRLVTSVPQAKNLADFFLVQKRLGQLAEGKNGWLKLVVDGKVHGSVNGLGAVTRRVTHARPNMSQCPAVRSPYGKEMRGLWTTPPGWFALGTDLSGIEIRCFADALAEFDEGRYADIVINGDVHTVNMQAFGVPTRDSAKTTLYALLYGAGEAKLGSIIGQGAEAGRRIKTNFMKAVPAYKKVVNNLHKMVDRQGWIPALDGGRLHVRSPHKALNTSLQSAGALVAKHWSLSLEERLLDLGMTHGWGGDFAFNVFAHDELFIACRTEEIAKTVGQQAKLAVKDSERHFEFLCPLDCEFKIGKTWADVH